MTGEARGISGIGGRAETELSWICSGDHWNLFRVLAAELRTRVRALPGGRGGGGGGLHLKGLLCPSGMTVNPTPTASVRPPTVLQPPARLPNPLSNRQ